MKRQDRQYHRLWVIILLSLINIMNNNKISIVNSLLKSWNTFPNCQDYSDQQKGIPMPEVFKKAKANNKVIPLSKDFPNSLNNLSLVSLLQSRKSSRSFLDESISISELSFLCYCLNGVNTVLNNASLTKRTSPSGGGRHPFEIYFAAFNIEGLAPGYYHYLSDSHSLELLYPIIDLTDARILVSQACNGQAFCGKSAATFFISAIPYRTQWRYMDRALKLILLDAGHKMQNLDIATNALNLGYCAIASLDIDMCNKLFILDGQDEFIIYAAPVGKILKN